jgi:hypothetical protein
MDAKLLGQEAAVIIGRMAFSGREGHWHGREDHWHGREGHWQSIAGVGTHWSE